MASLAWATDLHLDAAEEGVADRLCEALNRADVQAVLLGGDYSIYEDLETSLAYLSSQLTSDVYFVLGNHDHYGADVDTVRSCVAELGLPNLHWLPREGLVEVRPGIGLVGHGGWGDGRLGDFAGSSVILTNYLAIKDLADTVDLDDLLAGFRQKDRLRQKLAELGHDAAESLRPGLEKAVRRHPQAIVLTHVPPFRDACWHAGQISTDEWLPGFTCAAIGDLILGCARSHPECNITVLCGHTHGSGVARILPNLCVHTSQAQYGQLGFRLIQIGEEGLEIGPDCMTNACIGRP